MTPSSDSIHSSVSSGSMSGSWLGRPSLITGRLRSVATGLPYRDGLRGRRRAHGGCYRSGIIVDLGTEAKACPGAILPPAGPWSHANWAQRDAQHVLVSSREREE